MARAIEGGPSALNALLYGEAHPSVSRYVQQASQFIQGRITDAGRAFMDSSNALLESMVNHDAFRLARAAMRKLDNYGFSETIRPLTNVGQLQNAPSVMIPWIMMEPGIRQLHQQGRCEGYGDEYTDPQPDTPVQECLLYRAIMNGIVTQQGDIEADLCDDLKEEPNWGCWNYFEDDIDEVNLKFHDQVAILDTWDVLRAARSGPDDPTSRWNASW